jgi:putative DNA primase/helicase
MKYNMLQDSSTADSQTGDLDNPPQSSADLVDSGQAQVDIDAATQQFAEAIYTNLGAEAEPIPDGEIHRFDATEKRAGNKNCWSFMDETGTYGIAGNWGTGEKHHWYLDDFEIISDDELAKILEKVETAKQQRTQQRRDDQEKAALKAEQLFNNAEPADSTHAYLQKKWIPSANARQIGDTLLIPLRNIDGDIRNMQRISPSGKKRFLKNGEVTGNFSLIGADELPAEGRVIVGEGWATAVTLHKEQGCPVVAAMNSGNLTDVCNVLREKLPDSVSIKVAADDDRRTEGNPGLTKAFAAGDAIGAEVIRPEFCDDCKCTDFNDVAACKRRDNPGKAGEPPKESAPSKPKAASNLPIPLTTSLPPVKPLVAEMLPDSFVGYVTDVSTRFQFPMDYIAVTAIAVGAGILGGKRRIHPKQLDDWLVTPTAWAALVGGPSAMKSPCLKAGLKPVYEIEKELAAAHADAMETHKWDSELAESYLKSVKKEAVLLYGEDREKAIQTLKDAAITDKAPTLQRYVINDSTVEKCGELMSENPNGLLLVRDELSGWLSQMTQEEYQAARAFYLECFEGNNPFNWDRIARGNINIETCTLSACGGIQPSRIGPIIQKAINGQVDDGLIQRFQFAVWPDMPKGWKWIDQAPDEVSYARYRDAIRELHDLPVLDDDVPGKHLRFSKSAQTLYIEWMEQLHADVRSDSLHPVMQAHLAKMPKTVAGLALEFELLDGGRSKVGKTATAKAIMWADYLQSHAERLYSLSSGQGITGAKLILSRRAKLPEIFTAREVQRKSWAGLSSPQTVAEALDSLVDHGYLTELPVPTTNSGGRPSMRYRWHPAVSKKS